MKHNPDNEMLVGRWPCGPMYPLSQWPRDRLPEYLQHRYDRLIKDYEEDREWCRQEQLKYEADQKEITLACEKRREKYETEMVVAKQNLPALYKRVDAGEELPSCCPENQPKWFLELLKKHGVTQTQYAMDRIPEEKRKYF